MDPIRQGKKVLFGEDATNYSVGELRGKGVVFIPESPLQMAVVPWFPVFQIVFITRTSRYAQKGGLSMNWALPAGIFQQSYKNAWVYPSLLLHTSQISFRGSLAAHDHRPRTRI